MYENLKNKSNQRFLSDNPKNISAKKIREQFNETYDELSQSISAIQEGVSRTSIYPTTPLNELNALPNAVYRAFGEGTYKFNPALQIVTGSPVNVIPPGYSVKFLKSNGWSVASIEKFPIQDLAPLDNRITEVELKIDNFEVEVDETFNYTSNNAQSGVGIGKLIGEFTQQDGNTIVVENDLKDTITWKNGFHISAAGIETAHVNTRYCQIRVKAGDSITWKGQPVLQAICLRIRHDDGTTVNGTVYQNTNIYLQELVFAKPGIVYFNQNLDATIVETLILKSREAIAGSDNLVNYVDSKFQVNSSDFTDVDFTYLRDNVFFDIKNAVVNTSIFTHLTNYAPTYTSELIVVNKGDVFLTSGRYEGNGIALFGDDGKLKHKIFYVNTPTDVIDHEIVIPEDGYMQISALKSGPITLKKSIGKKEITVQELYNLSNQGASNITVETFINLDKPNTAWLVDVIGVLPTVADEVNEVIISIISNNTEILRCKAKVELQGQSSLRNPKKNYTFDLLNANDEKLKLKIGGFIASDSFHIKGFQKDVSLIRDNLTGAFWHKVRKSAPFPSCLMAQMPNDITNTASDKMYFEEDARFFADGFPIRLTNNGQFQGVYVWRLKKSRENYKLDNSLKTNIFLEFDYMIDLPNGLRLLDWNNFDYKQYELKSPKISGYEIGGVINDPDVMVSINNFWSWTKAVYNNQSTTDKEQYVDLMAWIDYLIVAEVADHWDGFSNNILIMSHDGIKFCPYIYDTDHTWGIQNGETFIVKSTKTSFILEQDGRKSPEDKTFWKNFRTKYNTQIKARYTELRNKGIISIQTIDEIALNFIKPLSYEDYKKEFSKWGYGSTVSIGKASLRQILEHAHASINYIDTQWKNN